MLTGALLDPLLYGAAIAQVFAAGEQVAQMVRFEVALAYALADAGVAPAGTGEACEAGAQHFGSAAQMEAMAEGAVASGNIAIPFVKLLTQHVREHAGAAPAADFIHYGATSQDVLDTALVLQLREAVRLAEKSLQRICLMLRRLAVGNRDTLLPGRTWMQQGPPVTFGLKAAQWLSATLRHTERLRTAALRACTLQFGGAVGTLASLGEAGPAVTRALAARLELPMPDLPWHTERDSLVELAGVLAMIDGTCGKIARDLALMLQNEVAEVAIVAGEGAGGSSTMPHKRNPVSLAVVLAAAVRAPGLAATMMSAMVQEHERGLGGWHAEWDTLPELVKITCGALSQLSFALEHLRVDRDAMQRNLESLHGVTLAESVAMRLAEFVGRPAAHRLLEDASRRALAAGLPLFIVLENDAAVTRHLSAEALAEALDPLRYLGSTHAYIDRVLAEAATLFPEEAAAHALR